jgi:isoleucyl-tRNA synthetase
MEYRETLNLPKTDFPMKADLVEREPLRQARWLEQDLYARLRERTKGRRKYVLHDGPPYANGDVHLGTALNKISKDIVVRYKALRGFETPFVPGWDCHGMPIEHKVLESLPEADRGDRGKVREECRRYAERFVALQREQFKRLGILGDWDHPYLTMSPDYQATIVRIFGELAVKGFIYRGLKPVYWCTSCQSALAEAEVEYEDLSSPSVTVRFEVGEGWPAGLGDRPSGRIFVPIWTTTPWTLPANRAVAVHPDLTYAWVESEGDHYLLAQDLVAANWQTFGKPYTVRGSVTGRALEGLKLQHPFLALQVPVVLGTHVTLDAGTGAVHTAPGHGQEDFLVGKAYGLEVYNPVGPDGRFTAAFPEMQGEFVFDADARLIELLRSRGALLHAAEVTHSYPNCWRHHRPVIFRATEQWFLNVDRDGFRSRVLDLIHRDVTWVPAAAENRIGAMVEGRPDWCLSRQRIWGVPVPVFYCRDCGEPLLTAEVFQAVETLVRAESADAWFTRPPEQVLPQATACPKCRGTSFRAETDILDVWFDSGVSHAAVLQKRRELKFPADLYLEGSDQHRGWFQVSLLTSAATNGQAPYRSVLTHGYTVDGDGRKMSKSLGNFISAEEGIRRYGGADIVRLWVASENVQSDVRFSDEIFKRVVDAYRRIRNTLRFCLGNLHGFVPADEVKRKDLPEIDRLLLHRLQALTRGVTEACEAFEFHRSYQLLHAFCAADLSAFYFDILKDRLYADAPGSLSRRSAQTVLWRVLNHLVVLVSPFLVHTADEAWEEMRRQGLADAPEAETSVHLATWPSAPKDWEDAPLAAVWDRLFTVRDEVQKLLEDARARKEIGHAYDADVVMRGRGERLSFLASHLGQLAVAFGVSTVRLEESSSAGPELLIKVVPAAGKKCERCWKVLPSVGASPAHPGLCTRCEAVVAPPAPEPAKKGR